MTTAIEEKRRPTFGRGEHIHTIAMMMIFSQQPYHYPEFVSIFTNFNTVTETTIH